MGKKSLAEQIAELRAPKNDFDIEDSEIADPFGGSDQDGNRLELDDEAAQREHYVPVAKSRLRREDALLKDKKYTGKLTDRKALYEDHESGSDGTEDGEGTGESGLESGLESSEDIGLESAADASDSDDAGLGLRAVPGSGLDDDSGSSSEESSGSASDAEGGGAAGSRQRDRIKQMMASERKHIVSRLSQSAAADALKGYSILQQHKEFDALIDARLKVQKALTSTNLLPKDPAQLAQVPGASEDTAAKIAMATDTCYDLLDTVGALRNALLRREQLPVPPGAENTPKKRSLAQYLARSSQQDAVLAQYRATVLAKWLAKIQNSSGSSAMNASKFKALNQSAEQQVLNNLLDMDRLVKRTRLNRRKITPLGYVASETRAEHGAGDDDASNDDDAPQHTQTRTLNMQELPQIFDDEDFYRVLLNDLVDKKIQSSDPTAGLQFALRGAASTKLKKNVDSKASKGRKLRFHVQEPIANFDTPRQWVQWNDAQIDEFFASLLGQKISMGEADDESGNDSDEDEQLVGDDSIQLFG